MQRGMRREGRGLPDAFRAASVFHTGHHDAFDEVPLRAQGQALYRETLYERVWGLDAEPTPRALDLHIHRLRKKLNWANKIVTVPKIGYRLIK